MMTEEEITTTETSLDDFASVFDDWIAGASLTRVPVTIYGAGKLHAEFRQLEAEQELLEAELAVLEVEDAERPLSQTSSAAKVNDRLDEIEARIAEIHDEWQASKSVWIVEDISERFNELRDEVGPLPVKPEEPVKPRKATDKAQRDRQERAHTAAMQRYEVELAEFKSAVDAWNERFALVSAAAAVVRVEFADGRTVEGVTVDQIRKLAKAVGEKQVARLHKAVQEAMQGEPVIDAPL